MSRLCVLVLAAWMAGTPTGRAQTPGGGAPGQGTAASGRNGRFGGSIATDAVTPGTVVLSLSDALSRGLTHNLGIATYDAQVDSARGARLRSLRALLPRLDARTDNATQTRNLAAFGFDASAFPGLPTVVGPFNVFDARVYASQSILDLGAIHEVRSDKFNLNAAQADAQDARALVTLAVTTLYFQAVAAAERIETVRSQVSTAEALLTLATNQRNAGVTPGIDVVRAQVQLRAQQQRLIAAENDFAKQKLQLARAIGLPAAQPIDLSDRQIEVPLPPLPLEDAVKRAAEARADYRAVIERMHAAEASLKAAQADGWPTISVSADYGAIGSSPSDARRTFTVAGGVHLSLFDADRKGRELEQAALLRQRRAEAADAAQRIESEVRTAFLDVRASEQQLEVAHERAALARQELSLAQTRFGAGVTSNLEVIQAQQEVASAIDTEIDGTYAFNVAKAALLRAMGSDRPIP